MIALHVWLRTFAGNLLPGQFDALILGITQTAAQLLAPAHPLNPLGNWWFTASSKGRSSLVPPGIPPPMARSSTGMVAMKRGW